MARQKSIEVDENGKAIPEPHGDKPDVVLRLLRVGASKWEWSVTGVLPDRALTDGRRFTTFSRCFTSASKMIKGMMLVGKEVANGE